jgi:predicted amidohydrolase YtcJ
MPLEALVTGRIATFRGDAGFGWVEAIGIRDGRVAFAGSAVELETRADPHTERFELEPGEIAIPGLTDAHLHLADAAVAATEVDLRACSTLRDALAMLVAASARLGRDEWLLGAGWDQRRWGRWPTADDLAAALPARRVALWSFDHHALWVSPAAFEAAGIDAATSDPSGGMLRRTAEGRPDGVLMETACSLVSSRIPAPTAERLDRAVAAMARELLGYGIVGVQDPGSIPWDPGSLAVEGYGRLADRADLPISVHASIRPEGLPLAIERGLRSGAAIGHDPRGRARVGWLKLFADGTLGSQTAALLEPIEGAAERAAFRTPPARLAELAQEAADHGIATQIHAIGDAAVRAGLDALAPTAAGVPLMPRLEHVQLCHPDDRPRFAALGIAASVQPVHLRDDAAAARRDWGSRAETAGYAWRSLLEAGAVLPFGTDAPVEPVDPWPGIAISVLRRDPSWGPEADPFGPAEALSLDAALRAATVAPALTVRDPLGGRLVVGAPADLIVLPPAPREAGEAVASFATVRPRLVLVGGRAAVER